MPRLIMKKLLYGLLVIITLIGTPLLFMWLGTLLAPRPTSNINLTLSPTPVFTNTTVRKDAQIQLVEILPKEDTSVIYLPIQQLGLVFNTPVDAQDLRYNVSPAVEMRVKNEPRKDNIILLTPEIIWQKGITTVTVFPETIAKNGTVLGKKIEYRLNTDFPPNSLQDEQYPWEGGP